jgi:ribosomal protein L22
MSLRKLYEVSRPVMTMKVSAEREVFSNGITNQILVYWKMEQSNYHISFYVDCGDQNKNKDMLIQVLKMDNLCNRK